MRTVERQRRNVQETLVAAADASMESDRSDDVSDSISYVPHPDFDKHEFVHDTLEALPNADNVDKPEPRLQGQDYRLPNQPLLSRSAERALFLRMNLLRYMASRRQQGLCGNSESDVCQRTIRNLIEDADIARNEIMAANQRLVVSNASKFSRSGVPLADLVSEGNLALMKAITGFDVSRGFRFSTYATYAIRRHLSRYVQRDQKRAPLLSEDTIDPVIEDTPAEWVDQHPGELVRAILGSLAPRERKIVEMRFGLSKDGKSHTLRVIGGHFGISQERVRQLIVQSCADAYQQHACKLGME